MAELRTRIYIDGYNFYYGCLRGTPFKWLDVPALFEKHILPTILHQPNQSLPPSKMRLTDASALKYFTAKIIDSAARAEDSVSSQATYHNALAKHCGNKIEIILGSYSKFKSNQFLVDESQPNRLPRDCAKVQVWKLEEKQSDVNIALQMYDDAISGNVDQIILVTNDTDLAPALQMIKDRKPNIVRGLVIPTRKHAKSGNVERLANRDLSDLADWTRTYITDEELHSSQLPYTISGARRHSKKPKSWYRKPHHVEKMIELSKLVKKTEGQTLRWAHEQSEYLQNKRPIDLLETDEGAALVFKYIETYIAKHLPT